MTNQMAMAPSALANGGTGSWFDGVVLVVAVIGVLRGRRRGMSQELLDFLMWIGMVAAGTFAYKPGGAYLAKLTGLSQMWSNIFVYLGAAGVVSFIFMMLKNALKDKMAASDIFGRLEYPLGMLAGMVRFLCALILLMAVAHAPLYTEAEMKKAAKDQLESLGSDFFPSSFGEVQRAIFNKSICGHALGRSPINIVLIEPSSRQGEDLRQKESIGRQRERSWDFSK